MNVHERVISGSFYKPGVNSWPALKCVNYSLQILSAFARKNRFLFSVKILLHNLRGIHLDLLPGRGGVITIRTLERVGVYVCPLVVLHVRTSVERFHAYSAGKPLCAQTRRADSGGRGWSLAAQLTIRTEDTVRGERYAMWADIYVANY